MGSGAPRESSAKVEVREVNPEIGKLLTTALDKLDTLDPDFKQSRLDEKNQQLTKLWMDVNVQLTELIRLVGLSLIESHQIVLENGSDGGGQGATPWCEEGGGTLPRLEFRLNNGIIDCVSMDTVLAQTAPSRDLSYEWVEKVIAKWILASVKAKAEQG